jgi:hypothetical protein
MLKFGSRPPTGRLAVSKKTIFAHGYGTLLGRDILEVRVHSWDMQYTRGKTHMWLGIVCKRLGKWVVRKCIR